MSEPFELRVIGVALMVLIEGLLVIAFGLALGAFRVGDYGWTFAFGGIGVCLVGVLFGHMRTMSR